MLNIEYSGQFKKDIKLLKKQGKNLDKLKHLLNLKVLFLQLLCMKIISLERLKLVLEAI